MSKMNIAAAVVFTLLSGATGLAEGDAKDLYLDKCALCHGPDGAGKTAKGRKLKVLDVHQTALKVSEAEMVKIVAEGKGKDMDAFGKDLKADQIAAVVKYYRSLAK